MLYLNLIIFKSMMINSIIIKLFKKNPFIKHAWSTKSGKVADQGLAT